MNSLKNVSLEQSWYGPLFRLRILFLIKIMTNLFFFYLSSLLLIFSFFFLIFVNLLLTSCKAPVFCFPFLLRWASGSYPTELNASICHFGTRISTFTGPREKATFLFLGEARNWLFGFRFFLAVKRPPCLFSAASPPVARARRLANRLPPLPVHIVVLAL